MLRERETEGYPREGAKWRRRLHTVVFGVDTRPGKAFDVILLWSILISVFCVLLESVEGIAAEYGGLLRGLEWAFTIIFTVEYVARLVAVSRPVRYASSFFGVIDLLAVLPTYLSVLVPGSQTLLVIRAIRLLRVFRIFKLARFMGEGQVLVRALKASRYKITVFVGGVLTLVVIMGAAMHLIEGPESGFNNIPKSMYWAIVTLTTVGYGDIAPTTVTGQTLASFIMLLGYGIIAIPTGIVTAELGRAGPAQQAAPCARCGRLEHVEGARFCCQCGEKLPGVGEPASRVKEDSP